jgi:hypothetical protein
LVAGAAGRIAGARFRPARLLGALALPVGTYLGLRIAGTPLPHVVAWSLAPLGVALVIPSAVTLQRCAGRSRPPLAAVLVLVSLGGVWAGPPENDHTVAAIGAALGCVVVGALWGAEQSPVAAAVNCLVVVWAALGGGADRFDPTMAGLLCLGVLPLAVVIPSRAMRTLLEGWRGPALLLGGHCIVVLVASRVYAARRPDAVGFGSVLLAGLLVVVGLGRATRGAARLRGA